MQPLSARPVLGSPRQLAPISARSAIISARGSARPSTTSAIVRGGGRLYSQSPLIGYSEAEMIREAQLRIEHNKSRQRLKHLLNTASQGGPTVQQQDLYLACQLAKMDMSLTGLTDPASSPRKREIPLTRIHKQLQYPPLRGRGAFGELPPTRAQRKVREMILTNEEGGQVNLMSAAQAGGEVKLRATDEEVYNHWWTLKRLMETRFSEIRRAFRLIDEDASGSADRGELKFMLNAMFNLAIPEHVLDRLIDLADFDGDGSINFAEFARVMTADNVLNMKKTLVADTSAWGEKDPEKTLVVDYDDLAEQNRKMAAGGYDGKSVHSKLRRTGPGIQKLRQAHAAYKKAIVARYGNFVDAFKAIDADGSGLLRRAELRKFLGSLSKSIPDKVITALIDFCDSDGDAKTLNMTEFLQMMEAETLGAGGYDPQAAAMRSKGTKV